ncbi:glycoside hydrolase family 16 protein [Guyanagaster necrorhizus]|uniref:Glycoside hydrolase family 16 protein n=1 Tax=Guyanagaster necrorhizus TaxID=856835 RepID=A0A9P7VNX6_9AGAR|nr:glycoside hydrolase family 16 protein [Guyanagaster necrorhizus MCA 3950]KAG7444204.1 glycoside hydrolase family 16 protein [Guyanagaster necrorhizus MCA 3950]
MPNLALLVALSVVACELAAGTTYEMIKEYAGSGFFDDWDYYDNYDNLTNGDAIFVGSGSDLTYIDSTTNRAIMKVDNTSTVAYNYKRDTVRIASKDRYEVGSIWIADMYHVPYGCSVWPAWWSQAPDWPTGGEIDTFEGVNLVTMNQMALHTESGCKQVDPVQSSTLINTTDCDYEVDDNDGCVVTDPSTASYGAKFAAAEGGVFVTEFAETGISIWFFSRSSVPSSISSNSSTIDTDNLGTPVANWPKGGCDIDTYFTAQNLIFDITLCGDFAGTASIFNETCTGTCYTDYVIGNASYYDTAYFDVASVRVYGVNGTDTTASSSSSSGAMSNNLWDSRTAAVLAAAALGATALLAI